MPALALGAEAALWIMLVARLEPSYLDFVVSDYAVAAGALVGAIVGGRAKRPPSST